LLLLFFSLAVGTGYLIARGVAHWPLPVALPLVLTIAYHGWTRRYPFDPDRPQVRKLGLWCLAAGAAGFVATQLYLGESDWLMLAIGAGGIGGGAGIFTWLGASLLLLHLALVRLLYLELRRPR
jgi:hypothetical protein